MEKETTVPLVILQNALEVNRRNLDKIYWQKTFIEYIKENNLKLYKEAKKYTDKLEKNNYFTEEEKKKWGIK